jgi:hypothetical protein
MNTTNKSNPVHAKLSQYLLVLVTIYPFDGVLDKNASFVDQYIQQCLQDAAPEARQNGRMSFLIWQKLAPDNA